MCNLGNMIKKGGSLFDSFFHYESPNVRNVIGLCEFLLVVFVPFEKTCKFSPYCILSFGFQRNTSLFAICKKKGRRLLTHFLAQKAT